MVSRLDIIQRIIDLNKFKYYLEIGVRDPRDCFNQIKVETKHSVDPAFELGSGVYKYDFEMTSAEFFWNLENGDAVYKGGKSKLAKDYKWDVIFIDGSHMADDVYKDVKNALRHLSKDGFIVLHDCNPPTIFHAREIYSDHSTIAGGAWNGTVWKAVQRIRQNCKDLGINLVTVDSDWGVGIIKRGDFGNEVAKSFNPFFEYTVFSGNRKHVLNLVEPEVFTSGELDKFLKTR